MYFSDLAVGAPPQDTHLIREDDVWPATTTYRDRFRSFDMLNTLWSTKPRRRVLYLHWFTKTN